MTEKTSNYILALITLIICVTLWELGLQGACIGYLAFLGISNLNK